MIRYLSVPTPTSMDSPASSPSADDRDSRKRRSNTKLVKKHHQGLIMLMADEVLYVALDERLLSTYLVEYLL